jgi:hypothetical protein
VRAPGNELRQAAAREQAAPKSRTFVVCSTAPHGSDDAPMPAASAAGSSSVEGFSLNTSQPICVTCGVFDAPVCEVCWCVGVRGWRPAASWQADGVLSSRMHVCVGVLTIHDSCWQHTYTAPTQRQKKSPRQAIHRGVLCVLGLWPGEQVQLLLLKGRRKQRGVALG